MMRNTEFDTRFGFAKVGAMGCLLVVFSALVTIAMVVGIVYGVLLCLKHFGVI